jgi:hypothetical protein
VKAISAEPAFADANFAARSTVACSPEIGLERLSCPLSLKELYFRSNSRAEFLFHNSFPFLGTGARGMQTAISGNDVPNDNRSHTRPKNVKLGSG